MDYKQKENKKLLLKDIFSRLPYRVKCLYKNNTFEILGCIFDKINVARPILSNIKWVDVELIKPYLRPISSMTEEEREELKTLCSIYIPTDSPTIGFEDYGITVLTHHLTNDTYSFKLNPDIIDWLNEHHFDYRGLIEKGLVLEAPEDMYNLKEK